MLAVAAIAPACGPTDAPEPAPIPPHATPNVGEPEAAATNVGELEWAAGEPEGPATPNVGEPEETAMANVGGPEGAPGGPEGAAGGPEGAPTPSVEDLEGYGSIGELGRVLGREGGPPTDPPPSPTAPSRAELVEALAALNAPLAACGDGEEGTVTLSVRIAGGSGHVIRVRAAPSPLSTRAVACARQIVDTLTVRPFDAPHFDFTYPFDVGG